MSLRKENTKNTIKNKPIILLRIVVSVFFIVLLISCDNSIDPFKEGKASYSIYGYLAVKQDTNYIRVKDLSSPLLPDSTRTLDGTVILKNLQTGQTQVLQDTIVQFGKVYTHNFITTLNILPDTKYRVTVKGPQGNLLSTTGVTPRFVDVDVKISSVSDPEGPCDKFLEVAFHPVYNEEVFRYSLSYKPFTQGSSNFCQNIFYPGPLDPYYAAGFCPGVRWNLPDRPVPKNTRVFSFRIAKGPDYDLNGGVCKIYLKYKHFGAGTFVGISPNDSLTIPGGLGTFGGFYRDTLIIKYQPDD